MSFDWNMAKTQFGNVLEDFRGDAIGIWLRPNLEMSQNVFDDMRLDFG